MDEKTYCDCIKLILKKGGRFRNKQIELEVLREYGLQYQNNTIAKYLSFLIKEGKVLSAPVNDGKGKACFEYWWVEVAKKKAGDFPVATTVMIEKCVEAAKTYPEDHPQRAEIMNQIHELESRERMMA
jgi:hypothetical protein